MPIEDGGAVGALEVTPLGDDGGGDGGDGGELTPGNDGGADGGDGGADGGDGGEPEYELDDAGEPKIDDQGNKIPKVVDANKGKVNFKANYDKLKETDPQIAEAYRKDHYGIQEYQKSFPTSREAASAKDLLDTYGGAKGIETINAQAQQFASEMEQFSQGDPTFLAQLAKDDPEGFSKSITAGIKELGRSNPDAYSAALAPTIHSSLEKSGITAAIVTAHDTMYELFQALGASGDPNTKFALTKAMDVLKHAFGYTESIKKLAEEHGERPLTDREKAVRQKEQQVEQKERDAFTTQVSQAMVKTTDGHINTALQVYFKQFPKLTKEQKADAHDGVFKYVASQLASNPNYQKQMKALVNEGDVAKINNFVSQNVKKIVQNSAKTVWNRRGFGALPNQQKNNAGGNNQGVVTLTRRPKREDIDWNKTTDAQYMLGEAVLKGSGKKTKWDWSKVE